MYPGRPRPGQPFRKRKIKATHEPAGPGTVGLGWSGGSRGAGFSFSLTCLMSALEGDGPEVGGATGLGCPQDPLSALLTRAHVPESGTRLPAGLPPCASPGLLRSSETSPPSLPSPGSAPGDRVEGPAGSGDAAGWDAVG